MKNLNDREKIQAMQKSFSFATSIASSPWKSLLIALSLVCLFFPGALFIKSKWSSKIWYDESHPEMVKMTQFEQQFGGDVFAAISLHHPDGIFQESVLKKVQAITEELWLVSDIIRVESLTNHNVIYANGDEIIIEPLIFEETKFTQENLKKLKAQSLSDDTIPNILLSKDATYTMIYAHLAPIFDSSPDYEKLVTEVRSIAKKYDAPGIRMDVMGGAPANHAFKEVSSHDNMIILPFMFTFLLILLYTQFRSFISVVLPITLIGLSVGVTFGLMGHASIYYNSLLAAIPGVLLAICIADAVHILNSYFHYRELGYKSYDSIVFSLTKNFQPTLLTSISTAISFVSLATSEIAPIRDLGLLCGFGTLLAWTFTYLFVGPSIVLLSDILDKQKVKSFSLARFLPSPKKEKVTSKSSTFTLFLFRFRFLIIALFSTLTILSVYIALQNQVNSDPIKYFHPNVPIRSAYDFAGTKFDGLRGIEFIVDSGEKEGIKDPAFLNKLDGFIKKLQEDPKISQVQSIVDIIKKMNQTLNGNDPVAYAIPDSKKGVAEELLLYTMGLPQGMDLNNQFTLDNKKLRLKVVWSIDTSKESEAKMNEILKISKNFKLNVIPAGNGPLNLSMNRQVVSSFFTSMAMALGLVSLLLFFVYKDVYVSLLSLLPNVIPLCFGGALMQLMGISIDIGSSIVCTVCLGIAVDDTIHFISSFKQYRSQGKNVIDSITNVLNVTGKALIITTVLLFVGFGSFIFADFVPNRNFGMLCSLILAMALITDLIFLPALLMVADRKDS